MVCTRCEVRSPQGGKSWCQECSNSYSRINYAANAEDRRRQSRERYGASDAKWAYNLKRNYGLTASEYYALLDAQEGLCAICGEPPSGRITRLVVDHDHETSRVRGLLCTHCNHLLGNARDNVARLFAAAEYLVQRSMVFDWAEGGVNGFRPRQVSRFDR